MNQIKIGKFIATERKKKNLTQEKLAEKLNVSINAVSKWERGLCLMDLSLLQPLAGILDIKVIEILEGEHLQSKEQDQAVINLVQELNFKKSRQEKVFNITNTIVFIMEIMFIVVSFRLLIYKLYKEFVVLLIISIVNFIITSALNAVTFFLTSNLTKKSKLYFL